MKDAKIGDKIERKGFVQCMSGDRLLVNTQTDEIISIRFEDREERMKYYCKHVKITIEVIDEKDL